MELLITLVSEGRQTLLRATKGRTTILRGSLPRLSAIRHQDAVTRLLEALALLADTPVCVALLAGDSEHFFRLGLTDEMGVGVGSVYYSVLVASPAAQGDLWAAGSGRSR